MAVGIYVARDYLYRLVKKRLGEGCHVAGSQQALSGRGRRRENRIEVHAVLVDVVSFSYGIFDFIGVYRDYRRGSLDYPDSLRLVAAAGIIGKRAEP